MPKTENRYSRQTIFSKLGKNSQELLKKSSVVVVGIGALGCVVSNLLVRSGVGKITLIDFDSVELVNLQRQTLFDETDVEKNKAIVAKEKLDKVNSEIMILAYNAKIDNNNSALMNSNLVFDCTDNINSRLIINSFCRSNKIPLIHVAAIEDTGNVILLRNKSNNEPCINCIYTEKTPSRKCSEFGVLNTLTGAISGIAVNEGIKFLTQKKQEYETIIRLNIWNNEIIKLKLNKNKNCPVCSKTKKGVLKLANLLILK